MTNSDKKCLEVTRSDKKRLFFLCEGVVLKRFEETLVCLFFFAVNLAEKRLKSDSETFCFCSCSKEMSENGLKKHY